MNIIYVGIAAIIVIAFFAIYLVAKMLRIESLTGRAILSFSILLVLVGAGVFYYFGGIGAQEEVEVLPFAVENSYFSTFAEAVTYSKTLDSPSPVYYHGNLAWEKTSGVPNKVIEVPLILQLPELARGSEITSLAMLLTYAGVEVTKLELAEQVKKDQTPLKREDDVIYFGHPNDGFVGNIYTTSIPGIGVFHKPIRELAELYLPDTIVDMTGAQFEDVIYPIHQGIPVWVLIHNQFKTLPETSFQKVMTPSGEINVTPHQHSVLITGYDENHIYFNDPLSREVSRPISREQFKAAWMQMGQQAVSYVKK